MDVEIECGTRTMQATADVVDAVDSASSNLNVIVSRFAAPMIFRRVVLLDFAA